MTIEDELKNLILSKYKSIREFCFDIGMPYTTIDSILRRGIENAGVGKIIKICRHFNISTDELAEGKIVKISLEKEKSINDLNNQEQTLVKKYRALDERGKILINTVIDAQIETKNVYK